MLLPMISENLCCQGNIGNPNGKAMFRPLEMSFSRKVKAGVFANATASGIFKPVFDEFKLTLIKAAK
jgi:hypothetical protein